jgi:hypothetical protein
MEPFCAAAQVKSLAAIAMMKPVGRRLTQHHLFEAPL